MAMANFFMCEVLSPDLSAIPGLWIVCLFIIRDLGWPSLRGGCGQDRLSFISNVNIYDYFFKINFYIQNYRVKGDPLIYY